MISRQRRFLLLPGWRWPVVFAFLVTGACGQPGGTAQTPLADEWHAFEGTWTAAGTRRTLRLGPDDRAAIFELTGSVLLTGAQRPAVGFRAQAIGTPRVADPAEITDIGWFSPDALPRPMSDFTPQRIGDALAEGPAVFATIRPRVWLR